MEEGIIFGNKPIIPVKTTDRIVRHDEKMLPNRILHKYANKKERQNSNYRDNKPDRVL